MTADTNQRLCTLYEQFDTPADQIVTSAELREAFADRVRARAAEASLPTQEVMKRLLALRKAGRLPRIRRDR